MRDDYGNCFRLSFDPDNLLNKPRKFSDLILCEICGKRQAVKSDSESQLVCEKCANPGITIRNIERRIGRNEACPCGSGAKYKKCCLRRGE